MIVYRATTAIVTPMIHLGDPGRDLLAEAGFVPDDHSGVQDLPDRRHDSGMTMPQDRAAVGHEHVQVLAPVEGLDSRPAGLAQHQVRAGVGVYLEC
jgi:hypothetical protein